MRVVVKGPTVQSTVHLGGDYLLVSVSQEKVPPERKDGGSHLSCLPRVPHQLQVGGGRGGRDTFHCLLLHFFQV